MTWTTGVLAVALTAAAVLSPGVRHTDDGTPGTREISLSITAGDGQVLPATLRVPVGARSGLPGMVLVHGAGEGQREHYRAEAEAFASSGIATLTYDKRTVGYSLTQRSYSTLADDARAAAAVLRGRAEVDPTKVGFWGLSEGGWVAPLAASRDPRTAFLVVVGASGVPPLRQQSWAERIKAEHAGVRGSMVDAYSRTFWRLVSGMGMFPEAYFEPGHAVRRLTLPVLGVWGAKDRVSPPVESAAEWRRFLGEAGNSRYSLRIIDDAEHRAKVSTDGWDIAPEFAPGYVDLVASWVDAAVAGHAPRIVDRTGEQPRQTSGVPPLAWYESVPVQAAGLAGMLIGFVGFAAASAWRTLRGGNSRRWAPHVMAVSGPVAALGAPVYLGYLQMTSGGTPTSNGVLDVGPMLAGRPVVWLALQLLAVTTVAAGVVTAVQRRRLGGAAPYALLGAGALFVPWALYWGLLLP